MHENPVARTHTSRRPKVERSLPAYFTDAELERVWPALTGPPAHLALAAQRSLPGMRSGELLALGWNDVELLGGIVTMPRTYVAGIGETTPKSGQGRTVDLTPQALELLQTWCAESGGEGLVFEDSH